MRGGKIKRRTIFTYNYFTYKIGKTKKRLAKDISLFSLNSVSKSKAIEHYVFEQQTERKKGMHCIYA